MSNQENVPSPYLSLFVSQSMGFMLFLTVLALLAEWLVQTHLYSELFRFQPVQIWGVVIYKEYIAASAVLVFSKMLGLALLERVRYALLHPELKPPKLGSFQRGLVWSVLLFTTLSGLVNGVYIILKAEASGDGYGMLLKVALIALLVLLSLLTMLAASTLFALVLLLKPVKKWEREKERFRKQEIQLKGQRAGQDTRQDESERLYRETEADHRKRIEVVLLDALGLDLEEFINTLNKKKDEEPK